MKNRIDILATELFDFDTIASSETWLHQSVVTTELLIPGLKSPESKEIAGDRHSAGMIYVRTLCITTKNQSRTSKY